MNDNNIITLYGFFHLPVLTVFMFCSACGFILGITLDYRTTIVVTDYFFAFSWLFTWGIVLVDSLMYSIIIKKCSIYADEAKSIYSMDVFITIESFCCFCVCNLILIMAESKSLFQKEHWLYIITFLPLVLFFFFFRKHLYKKALEKV